MTDDLFDVAGKVVLVTGGADGMGRMIAEGFVRSGARVFITSRRMDRCVEAAAALRAWGSCEPVQSDLSTPEGAMALASEMRARLGRLDVLVNNAGKTWAAPLEAFPDSGWNAVMAINLQAPFVLVRELLPLLKAGGTADDPARVINIGSVSGTRVEGINTYPYTASKAAILHLTRHLAADLAEANITVNVVAPGYFPTRMTAHIRNDQEEARILNARIPLRRLGRPDDIAGACLFLASRAASYITGAEIPVDGGLARCT